MKRPFFPVVCQADYVFRPGRLLLTSLLVAGLLIFAGCSSQAGRQQSAAADSQKLKVVATIYPMYEFAKQVGGDKVELTLLIPPGAEPHDWDPTAKDLMTIKKANILLYNGAGLEPVGKIAHKDVLDSAIAVEVSKGIPLLKGDEDERGHDKDNHRHEADPHVWLDPILAQQLVNHIAAAFCSADPANQEYYKKNAGAFNDQLVKLDEEYRIGLAQVKRRDIVTSHAAFQYLTKRYGLKQWPIMGIAPDAEPTPEKMAHIVDFCKDRNVQYIFTEALVNPKVAATIAKETGAKLLILNPLDGLTVEDMNNGRTYLTIMRENLAQLKMALN